MVHELVCASVFEQLPSTTLPVVSTVHGRAENGKWGIFAYGQLVVLII
jgi:hypothetical protein